MLRNAPLLRRGALLIRGPCMTPMGSGSAEQREERCTASGIRDLYSSKNVTVSATLARVVR
jgi:hypothetical protein